MLRIRNVERTYRVKNEYPGRALRGVCIDFPETGLVFIVGKSGCGKTTLLNLLGGLDKPDAGAIELDGKDLAQYTQKQLDEYRNYCVGFVFQDFNLLEDFTVRENVSIALELQGRPSEQKVQALLERMGLSAYAKRKPWQLSGGQRQRVAIARALVKEPPLLLADEPTGNLDAETGAEVFRLLKEISSSRLVVVVTHDLASAQEYGDRRIELSGGKVVGDHVLGGDA